MSIRARTDDASANAPDEEPRLRAVLRRRPRLAVAVSGGVDSMTLAYVAHRTLPGAVAVIHAVSPAVPAEATERVRAYARREGWDLTITGTGEFDDAAYRANPVDRCYYCKSNLYDRIRAIAPDRAIASGANLDDLDDYRPGLIAAAQREVVHPYIEARIDKAGVRALAGGHGLADLAELPAQPCLSSRVETGIRIDPVDLAFVHRVESEVSRLVTRGAVVRCRVTGSGVVLELGEEAMHALAAAGDTAARLCAQANRVFAGVRPYRRGAAFLRVA